MLAHGDQHPYGSRGDVLLGSSMFWGHMSSSHLPVVCPVSKQSPASGSQMRLLKPRAASLAAAAAAAGAARQSFNLGSRGQAKHSTLHTTTRDSATHCMFSCWI